MLTGVEAVPAALAYVGGAGAGLRRRRRAGGGRRRAGGAHLLRHAEVYRCVLRITGIKAGKRSTLTLRMKKHPPSRRGLGDAGAMTRAIKCNRISVRVIV